MYNIDKEHNKKFEKTDTLDLETHTSEASRDVPQGKCDQQVLFWFLQKVEYTD